VNAHARRAGARAAAAALAAALLVPACSGDGFDPLRPPDRPDADGGPAAADTSTPADDTYPGLSAELAGQRLAWEPCPPPTTLQGADFPEPGELADGTPWQCADLTVPRDWDDPDGATIDIALIRAVTSAPAEDRLGSLVFNFGGPGASGVATLPLAAEDYEALRAGGFDLVSFDPRGVGESEGVVCLDADEVDAQSQDPAGPPDTPEEEAIMREQNEAYIAACVANAGDLLPHLTTVETARDLDLLRHALGDDHLNYFGISYGTELGAAYAHLYPERIGRTVLDAVVDPTATDPVAPSLNQAEAFQLALEHYLADCATLPGCPLGDDPAAGTDRLSALLTGLESAPLPTSDPDGRRLTAGLALTAVVASLYSEDTWEYLTMGLTEALDEGTGNVLLSLADLYEGRDSSGEYSNQNDANAAINCADDPTGMSVAEMREYEDEFTAASPVFGPYLVWGLTGCEGWPVTEPTPLEVGIEGGAAPVLLVGTTGDPATPYEGAEHMQQAMGGEDTAVLLTYDGEGHGAYAPDRPCVADAVNAHLLQGTPPANGTVCR
jgi:pimeloyl-ACP methyl ester carboxylesterase